MLDKYWKNTARRRSVRKEEWKGHKWTKTPAGY
jgi:hypothetical protein